MTNEPVDDGFTGLSDEPLERIETPEEVTDEQIQEFLEGAPTPEFHTILEVWSKVLEPAAQEAKNKITPQYAMRVCSQYREVNFADMPAFAERFYGLIAEFVSILEIEIATDEKCLSYQKAEDDAEHNAEHYKNLLRDWQLVLLQHEIEWDVLREDAATEIAALGEVHKMFFGQQGLSSYLDQIGFVYTEADQLEMVEAINELKASSE